MYFDSENNLKKSMLSFWLKLGLAAVVGVGFGLALLLQQELHRREIEYDRPRREPAPEYAPTRRPPKSYKKYQSEEETQRQLLETQLNSGSAECVICIDSLSVQEKVWSCPHCWNIFHLNCISKWADIHASSQWSCPVCRKDIHCNAQTLRYRCMCGREIEPKVIDGVTPHCCGKPCRRDCGRQCHPGPCSRRTI